MTNSPQDPIRGTEGEDLAARLAALPFGATVLVVGMADTGKTTLVWKTVMALTAAGLRIAVVDCDLGQSEIGPPGTVGVALAMPNENGEAVPPRSLRDLPLLASYFIGATTPARHGLEASVGACQMARVAKKSRPHLILVDTCGWVQGGAARRFKRRLAELLLPHAVIALTRDSELDPFLASFGHLILPHIWRVPVSPYAGRKTPAACATRRAARFLVALEEARDLTFGWDQVAFVGTSLGLGQPVAHHLQLFLAQSLRLPVLHAEHSDGGIYIVVNGERWDAAGLAAIEAQFRTHYVTVVPAQKFAGLLLGLVSAQGSLLDIALLSRLDFSRRTVTVRTSCRRPNAVAQLWFGSLRLSANGREKGENRPGEI
jgi:polynucleotide 5'-hydroxyl-kinase GRC3/NOL9